MRYKHNATHQIAEWNCTTEADLNAMDAQRNLESAFCSMIANRKLLAGYSMR